MIRQAIKTDLKDILEIYKTAKVFMKNSGNPTQWPKDYPSQAMLTDDIERQQLYVYEENGKIHGVFVFIIGDDPTYAYIENGTWLSESTYGTIHRIASDGKTKGIFEKAFNFCKKQISHLRIDTHENNKIMQYLIEKHGFKKCGTIFVLNKSPRIAYEYI